MRRAFKYRAYVSRATDERLRRWQESLVDVWNRTQALCEETYRLSLEGMDVPVTAYQDPRAYSLIAKSKHPAYADVDCSALQYMQIRYFLAMKAFFRRCRQGEERKGYPRPKVRPERIGIVVKARATKIEGNHLLLRGMGVRLRMHRPLAGVPKTVTLRREGRAWYAIISCDQVPAEIRSATGQEITLSFGSGFFVRDSKGRRIFHPAFYESELAELRRRSRALSRKVKGSNRWRACARSLARWHEHVRRRREHWLWSLARFYAVRYDRVRVPHWPLAEIIEHATTSKAAMRLCDSAYGIFIQMLQTKAEEMGREIVEYRQENAVQLAHAL